MAKERLDVLLVRRGLCETRERAQRLILAGRVRLGGQPAPKPGTKVADDADLTVEAAPRFVGRGGEKLEGAFAAFHLEVVGLACLDVGASTGGFTDCLLQHGARRVVAVDVGKGQIHWSLRTDPRVVVLEGVNARYLRPDQLPETPGFACVDVSFISLTKVLPAVVACLASGSHLVTLIKPQFEAGRQQVGKGGVVREDAVRAQVVAAVRAFGTGELGLAWLGVVESPLRGPAGNVEYLALWQTPAAAGGKGVAP